MRELTMSEILVVSGAGDECPSDSGGNEIGGVSNFEQLGQDLIAFYEGLVEATSYIIERVATSL